MNKSRNAYLSKLSIPSKSSEELSYIFTDSVDIDSEQRIFLFGIFLCTSQKEVYQLFIKELVDAFLDFYHKSLDSYKNFSDQKDVNSHEFLFESAIRYAHDQLLQSPLLSQEDGSQKIDFKKIHFSLGALAQDQIYVSGSGSKIFGYYMYPVFQKDKGFSHYALSTLIDGNQENERSAKLFSYLINGPVSIPGGHVCILNKALLDYLSLEQLRHILTNNPIEKVSLYIHTLLSKINSKHDFSALFINPVYNGPLVQHVPHVKQTASSRSMAGLNSTEFGTEQVLSPTLKPLLKNTSLHFLQSLSTGLLSFFQSSTALLKKIPYYYKKINKIILRVVTSINSGYQKTIPIFRVIFRGISIGTSHIITAITTLVKKGPKAFFELLSKSGAHIFSKLCTFFSLQKQHYVSLFSKTHKHFQLFSPRSKALLGIGCLFLILFVISVTTLYSKQLHARTSSLLDQRFSEIERDYINLESRILYEQGDQIKTDLLALEERLVSFSQSTTGIDDRSQKLQDRITLLKQKIFSIIQLENPKTLISLPLEYGQIVHMIPLQKKTIFISSTHVVFYDNSLKSFEAIPLTEQLADSCGEYFNTKSAFLCSQDLTKVYYVTDSKNELIPYTLKKHGSETVTSFATYNNRLYTLDTEHAMIFRHVLSNGSFETGSKVFTKEIEDLSAGKTFSIDGSIFVLTSDNTVLKIIKNKHERILLPPISPSFTTIDTLLTNENTPYLFLFDSEHKRIVLLNKTSTALISQITSPKFEYIKQITLEQSGKEILILTNSELLSLPVKDLVRK